VAADARRGQTLIVPEGALRRLRHENRRTHRRRIEPRCKARASHARRENRQRDGPAGTVGLAEAGARPPDRVARTRTTRRIAMERSMTLDSDPSREAAAEAGLRWSTDAKPGIARRRAGNGFSYRAADGSTIRDRAVIARIRALAIPPAWTDVWICPDPRGHLQATGRDARGRKQHRYHPAFREHRDGAKFDRMIAFAGLLPTIRERVEADLGRPGLAREKVLAAVVRLLELTLIRVGNEEYARLNKSFGLTTLRDRHARIEGSRIRFRFNGKSGKRHEVTLRDRRLARVVARCQDLPGQDLLQYEDEDGEVRDVRSEDVNAYLREASGGADVTAKDFRTWAGTVLTYRALRALQPSETDREARRNVVEAIRQTSEALGNTPAVARKSYVHPAVLQAYLDGGIGDALVEVAEDQAAPPAESTEDEEAGVVDLLRQRIELDAARSKGRPARREGRSRRTSTAA
jgi:DNA topoisomerase-1